MIHFYGIPNCDTVKKARTWLDAKGRDYVFHDFKKEGADQDLVRAWVNAVGWNGCSIAMARRSASWSLNRRKTSTRRRQFA